MKKLDMLRLAALAVGGYYVYTKYIKKPSVTITADTFDSSSPQALSISSTSPMDQLMMAGPYGRRGRR